MKHFNPTSALRNALQLLRSHTRVAAHLGIQPAPHRHFAAGWGALTGAQEAHILKVLHDFDDGIHERINERAALGKRIAECAKDGKVTVEESGRDCDCVQYSGKLHRIDAHIMAFLKLERDIHDWADGPFSLSVIAPAEEKRTRFRSRDLALEAYENGHPHHIIVGNFASLDDSDYGDPGDVERSF